MEERLRRLVLLRAGATDDHARGTWIGRGDPPLSEAGRAALRERRRHWEWADGVLASPLRRARESARVVAGGARVVLLPALLPRDLGHWAGLAPDEIERRDPVAFADFVAGRPAALPLGEPLADFERRIDAAFAALLGGRHVSPLVVSHFDVVRALAARALGDDALPPDRPRPGELVLATRVRGAKFRLGRASSDPPPLRSPLERDGLSGTGVGGPTERHVAHLELRLGLRGA